MPDAKIAVFAYNFHHKKTQDFLLRLFCEGYEISHVLACDPIKLDIPPSSIRTKIKHGALLHPEEISERIGAPYSVVVHNDAKAIEIIESEGIELGIIAGARILKGPIINAFKLGVINFHPGLIPEARGLDAMLWSIYNDVPLGVTAHLIDERIDAGKILIRREIDVQRDDTIFDLSEKLYEIQLEMLSPAIRAVVAGEGVPLEEGTKLNRKMPEQLEAEVIRKLPAYVAGHAKA